MTRKLKVAKPYDIIAITNGDSRENSMAQLLIRNVSDELKAAISAVAAQNGRSVQREVLATLEEKYGRRQNSFVDLLVEIGTVDGPDLELPDRETFRDFSFGE